MRRCINYQAESIRLYKARRFPTEWAFVGNLLEGSYFADASVVRFRDHWWLFVDTSSPKRHDTLRLFHAENLEGPWLEHPQSPITQRDPHNARPAGRVLVMDNRVVRFAQCCHPKYGTDVRAFEIRELTTATYRERPIGAKPVLGPGSDGWNAGGMHHIDVHRIGPGEWLACADGWRE